VEEGGEAGWEFGGHVRSGSDTGLLGKIWRGRGSGGCLCIGHACEGEMAFIGNSRARDSFGRSRGSRSQRPSLSARPQRVSQRFMKH